MNVSAIKISVPPARRAFLFRSAEQFRTLPLALLTMLAVTLLVVILRGQATWTHLQGGIIGGVVGFCVVLTCCFEARFEVECPGESHRTSQILRSILEAHGCAGERQEGEIHPDVPRWLAWDINRFKLEVQEDRIAVSGPWFMTSVVRRKLQTAIAPT